MPTLPRDIELARLLMEVSQELAKVGPVLAYAWGRHLRGRAWIPTPQDKEVFAVEIKTAHQRGSLQSVGYGYSVNEAHADAIAVHQAIAALNSYLNDPANEPDVRQFELVHGVRLRLDGIPFFERFLNPFPRKAVKEGVRVMVKSSDGLADGEEFPATVLFVALKGIKQCTDAQACVRALSALHKTLAGIDAYVLSTLFGAVVVVPDDGPPALDAILDVLQSAATDPFDPRVGVAHGQLEVATDVDGRRNIIGPHINTAARLAFSKDNDGCLVDQSYVDMFADAHSGAHWLALEHRVRIETKGKPHDPVMVAYRSPHSFAAAMNVGFEQCSFEPGVLVSYDLSGFSRGDRSQLLKRFRAVTGLFAKLRQLPAVRDATTLLAPGGDGGILVLTGFRLADVSSVAERLRELGDIGSIDVGEAVNVKLRVGVHYGQVATYRTADGVARPAGLALYVADVIAGDDIARRYEGVIVTRMIADNVSGGSPQQIEAMFERLPEPDPQTEPATTAVLAGVQRYVRR